MIFLKLDLDDLTTIKASAEEFLRKEKRLDVLWNNAGVMVPPQGSKTKQGYELQLGTNNVAPFLFTKLLIPVLSKTAKDAPAGSVRVVWVSSSAAGNTSPKGGVDMSNLDYKKDQGVWYKYGMSKAGNILQATEFAKRYRNDGINSTVSLRHDFNRMLAFLTLFFIKAVDPGFLKTDLYKNMPKWQLAVVGLILKDPIYGAYAELFAGLSSEIKPEMIGAWGKCQSDSRHHSSHADLTFAS